MEATTFYQHILGLEAPWAVVAVTLDCDTATITLRLAHPPQCASFACPNCQQAAPVYDHHAPRTWRHMDTCQWQTFLVAAVPRVACPQCGVRTVSVPWAEPFGRFTRLFERLAIDLLLACQVQRRVAQLLRLTATQVNYLQRKAVARGLARRDPQQPLRHLTLDEKSLLKGQHYVTILGDGSAGCVLEVVEHRTKEATRDLLTRGLSAEQKKGVRVVTLDMWQAFGTVVGEELPAAEVVHDRFHLSGYLNGAVDKTRRAENKRLRAQQPTDESLKGTKYLWLRSPESREEKHEQELSELCGRPEKLATVQAWELKEQFREFFACATREAAEQFFGDWRQRVKELGNRHLEAVAKMFEEHWEGLVTYTKHQVTNGLAESLNGRIQQLKAKARGFRRAAGYRVAILFHLGGLDLYPHTLR